MVAQLEGSRGAGPGDALSKVAARMKSPIFMSQRSIPNEQAVIDAIEVPRRSELCSRHVNMCTYTQIHLHQEPF